MTATVSDRIETLRTINGNHRGYGMPSEETLELHALGLIVLVENHPEEDGTRHWHALLTQKGQNWIKARGGKRNLNGCYDPKMGVDGTLFGGGVAA